jgi:hypothetical protein
MAEAVPQWLVDLAAMVAECAQADVDAQRIEWECDAEWGTYLADRPGVRSALLEEVRIQSGISRSFVKSYANGDPEELFLVTMAWGYGRSKGRGNNRDLVLGPPRDVTAIGEIVRVVRTVGAISGWNEMKGLSRIDGLGHSFGSKLLYAAGYDASPGLRPLVLDEHVAKALAKFEVPDWTSDYNKIEKDVRYYQRYLRLASDITTLLRTGGWQGSEEVVEFALFRYDQEHGGDEVAEEK